MKRYFQLKQIMLLLLTGSFSVTGVEAIVPDQQMLARKLNDQTSFMEYIDLAVSNLPEGVLDDPTTVPTIYDDPVTDYDLKMTPAGSLAEEFHLAIYYDQSANRYMLQSDYNRSHRELMKSLFHLRNVYRETLEFYIRSTDTLLKSASTVINRTRDPDAMYYLNKGYSNLVMARQSYDRGRNIQWKLFSNQVKYYQEGILKARLARRFGLLAYINASLPRLEKPQHRMVFGKEALTVNSQDVPDQFQKIQDFLETLMARKLLVESYKSEHMGDPITVNLIQMHQDNYMKFVPGRESVRNKMIMIQAEKLEKLPTLRPAAHNPEASGNPNQPGP